MRKIKKEIVIMTREELRESFAKEIEENMFEGSESVKEAEQKGKEMLEHFADALNSPKEQKYAGNKADTDI